MFCTSASLVHLGILPASECELGNVGDSAENLGVCRGIARGYNLVINQINQATKQSKQTVETV